MFRLNPIAKQARKSATLLNQQKRFIAFDPDRAFLPEKRPPNMADFRVKIAESSKADLFKHEIRGRRNTASVESLLSQVKASYEETAQYKFNEQDMKFIHDYFGFADEEVRIAQDYSEYEKVMFTEEDGERIPNFDKLKLYWGSGSDPMNASITEFENAFKNSLKKLTKYSSTANRLSKEEMRAKLRSYDFSSLEGKIPSRIIDQIKSQYYKLCDRYEPDLDAQEMFSLVGKEVDRGLEDFVDALGEFKPFMLDLSTKELGKLGPAFLQDAEGNYINDFESFDFIETFFPEVRDMMLKEMSVENYRFEFPWELKKYTLAYEDIVEMFHKHTLNIRRKELDEKSIIVVSSDKNAQEIARQLQHVSQLLDEASAMSREASAKKADDSPSEKKKADSSEGSESSASADTDGGDEVVWIAIEEQAGVPKDQIFGGRVSNYDPIDINAMLDAEDKDKQK